MQMKRSTTHRKAADEQEEEERMDNWVNTYWLNAQLQLNKKRREKGE